MKYKVVFKVFESESALEEYINSMAAGGWWLHGAHLKGASGPATSWVLIFTGVDAPESTTGNGEGVK